jgi:hypothetical protein
MFDDAAQGAGLLVTRTMTRTTSHLTRRVVRTALVLLPLAGPGGCGTGKLETGYAYRPLGASDAERRAFYSPRYTRAAAIAEQERSREAEFRSRRPDYRPGF